jgi:transcription antitermination factor NusG
MDPMRRPIVEVQTFADPVPPLTWFAAYTGVGRERWAVDKLRETGCDSYCPIWTRKVIRHRKPIVVSRPLFPRYVFAGIRNPNLWGAIVRADGVERLVRAASDRPAIISSRHIENLRAAEAMGQFDDTVKREIPAPFKPGQPVRVISGPMSGFVAQVVASDAKGRVRILMRMLGGDRVTSMKAKLLEEA